MLHDLLGAGARRETGEIGAGAGDGAADGFDERGGDFGIGPAESDASGVAGDFQRQAMSGFDDESETAGPEFIGESEETVRDVADERYGLFDGVDEDRESFGFGAALGAKDGFDRGEVEGIDGKAVESVGGNADNFAALDETSGVLHQMIFRRFGRNF